MHLSKIILFLCVFPVLLSTTTHKFYVSTTKVEYVPEKQSLQIISKIFIDDIEDVLQERYNPNLSLATANEGEMDEQYLKKYMLDKFHILLDGEEVNLQYIGREYDIDVVKIYLEAKPVKSFKKFEVNNTLLFDLTDEQQNIVHLKCFGERNSFILTSENPNGLLNLE